MTEKYSNKQVEIIRGLAAIARKNELSIKEITKTYNDFNHIIYMLYSCKDGKFKVYDSELEDLTLSTIEKYFDFKKNELGKFKKE